MGSRARAKRCVTAHPLLIRVGWVVLLVSAVLMCITLLVSVRARIGNVAFELAGGGLAADHGWQPPGYFAIYPPDPWYPWPGIFSIHTQKGRVVFVDLPLWPVLLAGGVLVLIGTVQRRTVDDQPVCTKCGYDLTGLSEETRCPECGQ